MRRFVMFPAVVSVIVLTMAGVAAASSNQTIVPVKTAVGLCNKHGGMQNGGCAFDTGKSLVDVDCNGKSGCVVTVTQRNVSKPNKRPPSGGTTAQ